MNKIGSGDVAPEASREAGVSSLKLAPAASAAGAFFMIPARGRFARCGKPWTDAERASLAVAWADPALSRLDVARWLRRGLGGVAVQASKQGLGTKA